MSEPLASLLIVGRRSHAVGNGLVVGRVRAERDVLWLTLAFVRLRSRRLP